MRKERILAVIMSVLLALSMIPATVFAAEIPALDGKLKIQGTAAEGRTLSAELKEVKPEGVTEDDVAYLWERKTVEDEETEKAGEKPELKELGKDKTYTVTQDDIGSKIVLTVTGKEENGYTGSLKVVSDTVIDAQTRRQKQQKKRLLLQILLNSRLHKKQKMNSLRIQMLLLIQKKQHRLVCPRIQTQPIRRILYRQELRI